MAQDGDLSKAGDKGKEKVVDAKTDDVPKDKDGKPVVNGKKEDENVDGEFLCSEHIGL